MVDIEWSDTPEKPEEKEFQKEKNDIKTDFEKKERLEQKEQAKKEFQKEPPSEDETLGIADLISEGWNEIAVEKGYEPVLDKQTEFLKKHTVRLENKYLKDAVDIIPELEALITGTIVFLPKYLKHKKQKDKNKP